MKAFRRMFGGAAAHYKARATTGDGTRHRRAARAPICAIAATAAHLFTERHRPRRAEAADRVPRELVGERLENGGQEAANLPENA
jgi:hypothetical protein